MSGVGVAGSSKVLRGCSWDDDGSGMPVSYRKSMAMKARGYEYGFRCVSDLP